MGVLIARFVLARRLWLQFLHGLTREKPTVHETVALRKLFWLH